ncbi:MAG TPA: PilZ domain-containing protein [Allosphingosinicella sp.]|nr:PilZ domain-containing protein [Allosphingosinicella sp.]
MGEMEAKQPEKGPEDRASPRTNLLLAATVEAGGRILPVRIRNLSETGAMIEGAGLPDAGMKLVLARGDLHVSAVVAWAAGSRRGVKFDGPTPVHEWTGGAKPKPLECTGLRDQRRVDAIQAEARAEAASCRTLRAPTAAVPPPAPVVTPDLDARLAHELGYVQRLLEKLGDELINDSFLVQRHGQSLQNLDLVGQILGHVAAVLLADDKAATVEAIGMDDLRARLKRKPIG